MTREEIAKVIYEELCYMYCNNCRYNSEIGEDDPSFGCDDCHRKYNGWGISMAEANRIAEMIGGDTNREQYMGCHGCRHYDSLKTLVICYDCSRAYKDRYEE